jgi:hypothetical protein
MVHVHFCPDCGTKLYLSFERFPDAVGVYGGTFDDPDWVEIRPDNAKHIFVGVGRHDTVIPAGMPAFEEHAMTKEGAPLEPHVLDIAASVAELRRLRQDRTKS